MLSVKALAFLRRSVGHVWSVGEADNADSLQPIRDRRHWPHHKSRALKAADAVEEQKGVLSAMHVRKKGAQGVHIRRTIETIHRGPPVASPFLPIHKGCYGDKKREETHREDRCGRENIVHGLIPHQLVLRLVQPVHQLGVAGRPIVRGHSAAFLSHLAMPDLTCLAGCLASAKRRSTVPQTVGHTGTHVEKTPGIGIHTAPRGAASRDRARALARLLRQGLADHPAC